MPKMEANLSLERGLNFGYIARSWSVWSPQKWWWESQKLKDVIVQDDDPETEILQRTFWNAPKSFSSVPESCCGSKLAPKLGRHICWLKTCNLHVEENKKIIFLILTNSYVLFALPWIRAHYRSLFLASNWSIIKIFFPFLRTPQGL